MERVRLIEDVLDLVIAQRADDAYLLADQHACGSRRPVAQHLRTFAAFMGSGAHRPVPTDVSDDAETRLLAAAARVLAATKDPALADGDGTATLGGLLARVDRSSRLGSFARYLSAEAALADARVDLALELLEGGPAPHEVWRDHCFASVMLACAARTAVFAGNISQALALLAQPPPDDLGGVLLRATRAVAAGNAADVALMTSLLAEVAAARVEPIDHLGRGIHLLLSYGVVATGDKVAAARHLLAAGGGADLEHLTVIDRVIGYELLVAAAIADDDLSAALAWADRADVWSEYRVSAPTVQRIRSRIALLGGDASQAAEHASAAVTRTQQEKRGIELAESKILAARAQIAVKDVSDAARELRALVEPADEAGYAALRVAAARELRAARRRLPPELGTGWRSLSNREREVAQLIVDGLDAADVARALHLSVRTVRAHTSRVLAAYAVPSRTALLGHFYREPTTAELAQRACQDGLTVRQRDIVALIARGRSNDQIGQELGISLSSVESHVSEILSRWQLPSRFAIAHRWWTAPTPARAVSDEH